MNIRAVAGVGAVLALAASLPAASREPSAGGSARGFPSLEEPAALEALRQEMNVAREVIPTALANTASGVRVVDTEAFYLAGQGVLLEMELVRRSRNGSPPVWGSADGTGNFEVSTIEQIPHVVQEIVTNVQLAIAPYQPEDLAELRELREEQREVRNRQRELRRELRRLRADHTRNNGLRRHDGQILPGASKDEKAETIREREAELAALDDEYQLLERDIDAQYDRLRALRQNDPPATPEPPAADLTDAVTSVACDYGGTLKSLPDGEHLTLRLRRGRESTFYVFRKEDLVACRRESIAAPELLSRASIYEN